MYRRNGSTKIARNYEWVVKEEGRGQGRVLRFCAPCRERGKDGSVLLILDRRGWTAISKRTGVIIDQVDGQDHMHAYLHDYLR